MIRDALASDLPAICAIYNSALPARMSAPDTQPVSLPRARVWFAAHTSEVRPLWVCERDAEVVAWLSFRDYQPRPAFAATAEVAVYVHADRRRQGIGRALLARAATAAPQLRIDTLVAQVFAHNGASIALFEQAGFQHWGLLPAIALLGGAPVDLAILGRRA